MEHIIEKVMKLRDATRDAMYKADEVCEKDFQDADELEQYVKELGLDLHQMMVVNDYVACLQTAWSQCADLSYLASIKNTLAVLSELNLIGKQPQH